MSRRLSMVLALLVAATAARAQDPDDDAAVLAYHKLTSTPLDLTRIAERSEVVRRASSFDRRDALAAEVARLERALAAADPSRELVARINDYVTPYDHDRGEFSIQLFTPGYFVAMTAFGAQYRLVFANADSARAIPMPKEEARQFDALLERRGRRVITEARYRIVGSGDPSGAVTGERVVRAELLSARLLDDAGRVLYTPRVVPLSAIRAAGGVELAGAAADAAPFDAQAVDVAGFRVGVKGKDLEATLARLYGATVRRPAGRNAPPGIAAVVAYNELACLGIPGRRESPTGTVCVTAQLDEDDVVRAIQVERLFPHVDAEVFRRTLVARYGPVALATQGGSYLLGWGAEIPPRMRNGSAASTALTAHYLTHDGFRARADNSLSRIRIMLRLVDASWANAHAESR